MSNVSNVHNVVKYVSGETKSFSGQRLAKFTYKTVTDTSSPLHGTKPESKAVSVPVVEISEVTENIAALAPHIAGWLQSVQDTMIKEMIESGAGVVSTESISIGAIVQYLESDGSEGSNRLTKESIGVWFDKEIADSLAMVLAEKLGVSEIPTTAESNQVMKVVATFKDKVAALAGGKTSYDVKMATSLKKCVELGMGNDPMVQRFVGRLDKMIEAGKKEVDLLDCL